MGHRSQVIKLRVTQEELNTLNVERGDVTMSAYLRRKLFPAITVKELRAHVTEVKKHEILPVDGKYSASQFAPTPPLKAEESQKAQIEVGLPTVGTRSPRQEKPAKGKTCRHGTEKGYNCWQCGGLAQI
jgi:hypothetical protein